MLLLDTPEWLRRAVWAVVAGVGLLAVWRSSSRSRRPTARPTGASPASCRTATPCAAPARSTQIPSARCSPRRPCSPSTSPASTRARSRARIAAALIGACVVGVVYTQSRAALIALAVAAVVIAVLQGVRPRVIVVGACAVVALGAVLLPQSLVAARRRAVRRRRVGRPRSPDGSLRGRTSENLAGLHMWTDHPLLGVGPDNFEVHYQTLLGGDRDRSSAPSERGAHNLYLESLAETGVLGAMAFLGVLWLALGGAWRARSRLRGRDAQLAEGLASRWAPSWSAPSRCTAPTRATNGSSSASGWRPGCLARRPHGMIALAVALVLRRRWSPGCTPGYPLALALLGRLRPRPRRTGAARAAAVGDRRGARRGQDVIAAKVANVLRVRLPGRAGRADRRLRRL